MRIASGCLHASGYRSLNIALPHTGIAQHGALVSHIDQILGFFIIRDTGNTYRLNLHASDSLPLTVQSIRHVVAQLSALGCHVGNADPVSRHLINRGLQRL